MKKTLALLLIILFLPLGAYPFWIWSPKQKTVQDSQGVADTRPGPCFNNGLKQFEQKHFQKAYALFSFVVKRYPDALEAAEAQYYRGRALEELRNPYEAALAYQKVIDSYPNSKRINEIIDRCYKIAEDFAAKQPARVLGMTKYDFKDHPSLVIFKYIADKASVPVYAARAQYRLGMLYVDLKRYDEAKEAFKMVIDKYPDSEYYASAKYELAQATAKGFSGTDYDSTAVTEATARLDEFLATSPDSDVAPRATRSLSELNDKEAKKSFDVAIFYQRHNKLPAARIYYQAVVDKYPDTDWAQKSRKELDKLGATAH